ncbi:MAG: hypothetical protein WBC99_01110, partial [Candidatus Omnitrophota bacterium]
GEGLEKEFAGSMLILENTIGGEKTWILRAVNPREDFISAHSAEDFLKGAIDYVKGLAKIAGVKHIVAPVGDQGAMSNRTPVKSAIGNFVSEDTITLDRPEDLNGYELRNACKKIKPEDTEEAEAGGDELGAQVSNIQKLDRLLKLLRLLKNDDELLQDASDRKIIEYVIEHLNGEDLTEETSYDEDLKIIKIKDEAKETRLGKAIERWAIRPAGGVKAINFQGKDGVWTIVGFSSELTDPATLEHEKKEIAYRRQGYTWWQAHERVEEGRNPYEEIKNRSERRIPDVERIILSRGVSVQKAEDLDGLVEEPLLEACKILFEKNIDTISTTANETNLQYLLNDDGGHYATISVNYDRLFPENKVIADDLVDGRRNLENIRFYRAIDEGLRMTPTLLIRIPITYETTIQEVHEKAVRVANLFKKQKYIPSDVRTLGEFRKLLGDPEATVEMFQEDGYYYDEENELIWSSREDYEKSLESVEEPSSSGALTHGEEIGAAGREEAVFNFSIIGKGFKSRFRGRDVHVRGINAETRRIRNYVSALRVRTAEEKAVVPTVIKVYVPVA